MPTPPNRFPTLATRTLMNVVRTHLEAQASNRERRRGNAGECPCLLQGRPGRNGPAVA